MRILCLGTAACVPEAGNDSAHYLIDDGLLVDTGWNAAGNLRTLFRGANAVHTLLLTHTHHDHILGLPGFLFDYLNAHGTLQTLTVYGPAETNETLARALATLQTERFYPGCEQPAVHELSGGETLQINGLTVRTLAARHPVPALSLRIESPDGAAVGFTGDTSYFPALTDFFAGVNLLFSECSFGAVGPEAEKQALGHMDLADAQRAAARASRLALVHLTHEKRRALAGEGLCLPLRGDAFSL